eukprot:TRINITY_DN2725_c0_g1_i1.p1 TRINITY_DN2725_c0_g1~~TRINITY_DN2725_c0_g1_i1.p1  ORF type:complete len:476 (+),score=80.63 TRINITY_DN2725_c0_g1_i1:90-1517(+)
MSPIQTLLTLLSLSLLKEVSGQGQECTYNSLSVQVGVTSLTTGCRKDSLIPNEGRCHYSMGTAGYYNCPSVQCVNGVWIPSEVQCVLADTSAQPHTATNQVVLDVNPAILQQYGQSAPEVQWVETLASFLHITKNRIQASRLSNTELVLIMRQTDCNSETCGANQICKDPDGYYNGKFSCTCTSPQTGYAENGFAECKENLSGDCLEYPCGKSNLQICVDSDAVKNGQFECACSATSGITSVSQNSPVSGCGDALLRNDGFTNQQIISEIVEQSRCCPYTCMSSKSLPSGYCSTLGVLGVSDGNVCQSFPTKRSCTLTTCVWDDGSSSCVEVSSSSDDSVSAGVWVAMVAIVVLVLTAFLGAVCWWKRMNAAVDKRTNSPPSVKAPPSAAVDVDVLPPPIAPPSDYESIPQPSASHLPSLPKHPPILPISDRDEGASPSFFDTAAAEQLPPLGTGPDLSTLQERKHPSVYSSMWD